MPESMLAIDQGTTSSRAVLFDRSGAARGTGQREFGQIYPQAGWVEHDPMEILGSTLGAVRDALAAAGARRGEIAAIGLTNQRETTIVWDKATGLPVHNAIVWQCRRTAPCCDELVAAGLAPHIAATTGLVPDAYFSGTKLKWILDHVPGARVRAQQGRLLFGTVDTWLLWNLTGGKVHATDYTNASRTMLFDIASLRWDATLLRHMGVPEAMLPDVRPSSGDFGRVADGIAGLEALGGVPVRGVAGDQHAALFGQCCFAPGQVKNTYGTGCFMLMHTGGTRPVSRNGLVTTIAWGLAEGRAEYALEGSIFNAGSAIKWLVEDLGLVATPQECDRLAESVPDAGGVVFVPAFTGLGAPHWDMYARGTIVGLTRAATKAHLARATLESIAYQVADLLRSMQGDSGVAPTELRVDGGVSRSDFLMQFQSDMLGVTVNRPRNVESTALGAAFLAGLAAGFWRDQAELSALWESQRVFTPAIGTAERHARESSWQRAVARARAWAAE